MSAVESWKWSLGLAFLGSGRPSSRPTETALTALGEAECASSAESGGRSTRFLSVWIEQPQRALSTLLIGNTLANIGVGALAASVAADLVAGHVGWAGRATRRGPGHGASPPSWCSTRSRPRRWPSGARSTPGARHHPGDPAPHLAARPASTAATSRAASGCHAPASAAAPRPPAPPVTSEEIEYLDRRSGTREGVLDEVKEELLNSVLEFADRVVKEIIGPPDAHGGARPGCARDEIVRVVTGNPYSRMPVYEGSADNIVGILMVRDIVLEVARGPQPHPLGPGPQAGLLQSRADEGLAAAATAAAQDPPGGGGRRVRRNER